MSRFASCHSMPNPVALTIEYKTISDAIVEKTLDAVRIKRCDNLAFMLHSPPIQLRRAEAF